MAPSRSGGLAWGDQLLRTLRASQETPLLGRQGVMYYFFQALKCRLQDRRKGNRS